MSVNHILSEIQSEWLNSLTQKKHPFRFFVLGTIQSSKPELRTVVLRDFNPSTMEFSIYTDERSNKVVELKDNEEASLLFYNPENLTQVRVSCSLVVHEKNDSLFEEQTPRGKNDYTTQLAPGSKTESPDAVTYRDEHNFFLKLVFKASKIEYLKLTRTKHIRAVFNGTDSVWSGEYITP